MDPLYGLGKPDMLSIELIRQAEQQKHLMNTTKAVNKKDAKAAASEFEKFFLSFMMKAMKKTVPKSELINTGIADDIYFDMFLDEVAEQSVKSGGLGLAKIIEEQIITDEKIKDEQIKKEEKSIQEKRLE